MRKNTDLKKGKLIASLKEALTLAGIRDGMTISFHHHLRNGDYIINETCRIIEEMGIRDITLHSSGVLQGCTPIIEQIKSGTITCIDTTGIGENIGRALNEGIMQNPAKLRTHGGFPAAVMDGDVHIDIAVLAASAADCMGNMNGLFGKAAFGSAGYAYLGARYADKVIVVTDNLMPYPLYPYSIDETYVDYVVEVDEIGDPAGIASGIVRLTKDPKQLIIAKNAADVIKYSGYLKEGMSFQTGAGGPSLAVTKFLKDEMINAGVKGSFILGGISAYSVDLLNDGLFETIVDTQCFDTVAIEDIKTNPKHVEISAVRYANPHVPSCVLDSLDVGILGGTEVDIDFNVNACVNSSGYIMGGSGGHGDIADSAKLAIIVVPLRRARLPVIVDKVLCKTTPGDVVDVVCTEIGIAVNPRRPELKERLIAGGMKVFEIEELKKIAEKDAGIPQKPKFGDRLVANVYHRTNYIIDQIYNVLE